MTADGVIAATLTVADVLDEAAAVIGRQGWWQGGYYDPAAALAMPMNSCAVCVRAAINVAAGGQANGANDLARAATRAFETYVGLCGTHPETAALWNDEPGRTVAEVVAALEGSARAWRERVA